LASSTRVLLIEHLDAVGAAAVDARPHAAALRAAGFEVEGVVLEGEGGGELLFASGDRGPGPGFDRIGLDELAARVRASRASTVLWASAARGGGVPARTLPPGTHASWWPTGHAPETLASGPLPVLEPMLPPLGGSLLSGDEQPRRRLSLWDGPFALVPVLPAARAGAELLDAFARVVDGGEEADLVVLAHPDAGFEQMARRACVGQRVHFVGPAPREAEHAWLGTAVVALVSGDAPLSGGLLLRALDAGCPLLPVGEAAAPIRHWLDRHALAWTGDDDGVAARLGAALDRDPAVLAARECGRQVAATQTQAALAATLGAALHAAEARARRAA
jgi:hypothetical protein